MTGFVAGTLVHTDKGLVPIQEIKVGDRVLSRPENRGCDAPIEYKIVEKVFCSGEDNIIQLPYICESEFKIIKVIYLTDYHAIWHEREKKWIPAIKLENGDELSFIKNEKIFFVYGVSEVLNFKDDGSIGYCNHYLHNSLGYSVGHSFVYKGKYSIKTDYLQNNDLSNQYSRYIDDFESFDIGSNVYPENFGGLSRFKIKVYNLDVEDHHTYFVGDAGIWVHC
ncbi:hypothetical protein F959_02482 [Acinetobacter venetianus RAG-1 = CIP 110063]|uniref:Intein C-terminal splicing domain-containing protein n=1 Tax=Acinetobacter venetianus (strain ATCC 31012 / DSM 23050 / BCRC 14357 / CCUG 45561 / CIP 110063 / KCTC 2702 / LMG 19082 / RAG-1) TaxID=1191460 RepID=N8ZYH1_ACIVR|nr:hypothetical protein [Acinetobacter venetianus]ENV36535.1 hypothetical protein F959_02482 [Acinetobacter venetianus RAG-1 = CIP 110063]